MSNRKIPMRKCVGCGEMKPKKEMLRVLRTDGRRICTGCYRKKEWARRLSVLLKRLFFESSEEQRAGAFF